MYYFIDLHEIYEEIVERRKGLFELKKDIMLSGPYEKDRYDNAISPLFSDYDKIREMIPNKQKGAEEKYSKEEVIDLLDAIKN